MLPNISCIICHFSSIFGSLSGAYDYETVWRWEVLSVLIDFIEKKNVFTAANTVDRC